MKLSYGKIADFSGTYYMVCIHEDISFSTICEVRQWCIDTFGPCGWQEDLNMRWWDRIGYGEIDFSREADLHWFLLRWL